MAIILRDRRLLPTFVALAVAAFLIVPMITTASVVNAQSAEDDQPCADVPRSEFEDRNQAAAAHRESIDCVDYYEITAGSGSRGQFYVPLARVTREQMATFIVNTLEAAGMEDRLPSGDRPDEFDDISDSRHRGNINKLARIGVVRGTGGDKYSPNDTVDRDAMATFILAAYEWAYQEDFETDEDYFGDVAESNTHFGNINAAYEQELVRGTQAPDDDEENTGRYNPRGDVLRQAMASFLANLLGQLNEAPDEFCTSSPSPSSSASASPTSGGGGGLPIPPIGGGGGGSPSPSSSASPTASGSPRPSSSASPSATASPTGTASEDPGACATQSGSPTPRPSGSASPTSSGSPRPTSTASPTPTGSEDPCFPGPPPLCV